MIDYRAQSSRVKSLCNDKAKRIRASTRPIQTLTWLRVSWITTQMPTFSTVENPKSDHPSYSTMLDSRFIRIYNAMRQEGFNRCLVRFIEFDHPWKRFLPIRKKTLELKSHLIESVTFAAFQVAIVIWQLITLCLLSPTPHPLIRPISDFNG